MRPRTRFRSLPIVGPCLSRALNDYRLWRRDPGRRLQKIFRPSSPIRAIQIGASDGVRQDPIRTLLVTRPDCAAVLVEPHPASFARLRENYPDDSRFKLLPVAIDRRAGFRTLHYIDESARIHVPGIPGYFDQLASFDQDYLCREMGSRSNEVAPYFRTAEVPTLPLADLLTLSGFDSIDLLIVDSNGHDWEIIRQLTPSMTWPIVVLFEHKHLSAIDRGNALQHLSGAYKIRDLGDDFLGVRRDTYHRSGWRR